MLKEKKLAEKRGNHDDAFRRAEITVRKFSRELEAEEDFEDASELTEDDAIRLATENPSWLTSKLMTPDSIQDRRGSFSVRQDDRRRLFEDGGGGTILDILKHDKAIKRLDVLSEKAGGIHLWCAPHQDTIVNQRSTSYPFRGNTPILNLLNASLKSGGEPKSRCPLYIFHCFPIDFHRTKTLLGMDFMTIVNAAERRMTAAALYDLGMGFHSILNTLTSHGQCSLFRSISCASWCGCARSQWFLECSKSINNQRHFILSNLGDRSKLGGGPIYPFRAELAIR